MRLDHLLSLIAGASAIFCAASCGSKSGSHGTSGEGTDGGLDAEAGDQGVDAGSPNDAAPCVHTPCSGSNIQHLVVIIQENQTFETRLGRYCTAATGSNPTCGTGPACCEAGPAMDPSGSAPTVLDDAATGAFDPNHSRVCEIDEMDGGKMDRYVTSKLQLCGNAKNFGYGAPAILKPLWDLLPNAAIADRYFQSVAGASDANNMYLARAQWVFDDNANAPKDALGLCSDPFSTSFMSYADPTIGDLLKAGGVPWVSYAGGYADMVAAAGKCPTPPADCPLHHAFYPCTFAPDDIPFEFYPTLRDDPTYITDLTRLDTDLAGGTLPAVSFVKALGYKTEHPGLMSKVSDGINWMTSTVQKILSSNSGKDTLVLVTYDESGGYFDHVAPPAPSTVDRQPYGPRIPLVAFGSFAKKNAVSHVQMEHASIVKFIEWNWLGQIGGLSGRDATAANIGSLLDPAATGVTVPEN
jgi:phospholipase C